jgi:putative methyltransferase (TIGR04325 family)
MSKARKIIKNICPPVITEYYKKKNKIYGFFGNYPDWESAKKHAKSYDSDIIIEKVKNSALKVKRGEVAYERDSVLFDKIDNSWPLLANLLWIASLNSNRLNVLDFGGALGTSYFQNISYLKHLEPLNWNIVEQKKFVDYGKELFEDENLKFYYTLEDSIREKIPNVILLSSVLQYLEKPYEFLGKIINLRIPYIIFDRTTFLKEGSDRATVQIVPPKIYEASYPCWMFNRKKFLDFFKDRYELIADFDAHIGTIIELEDTTATYQGFFYKKID